MSGIDHSPDQLDLEWDALKKEDAREAIMRHSGVILSEDDPIMALVPLLNAFSDTLKANLSKAMDLFGERSKSGVREVVATVDDRLNEAVTSVSEINNAVTQENIATHLQAVAHFTEQTTLVKRSMQRMTRWNGFFASINILAVIAIFVILKQ
ncbi:hypothetical protein [Cohaesibacter haloalkalitolerans]|uniref:hypothetical protein n=1 Tax=Cohaesibacter haloalkalitolerans TaxID=1162980 RepID=UPI000E6594AA|nr:hypothetical protein [Cohaesibacter haloalkalitolerans]